MTIVLVSHFYVCHIQVTNKSTTLHIDHPCSNLLEGKCSRSYNSEPPRGSTNLQEGGQPMEKFNTPLKEPETMLLATITDNAQLSRPA
jgi:hypothetical protein